MRRGQLDLFDKTMNTIVALEMLFYRIDWSAVKLNRRVSSISQSEDITWYVTVNFRNLAPKGSSFFQKVWTVGKKIISTSEPKLQEVLMVSRKLWSSRWRRPTHNLIKSLSPWRLWGIRIFGNGFMKFNTPFLNILLPSELRTFVLSLFHSLMTDGKFVLRTGYN